MAKLIEQMETKVLKASQLYTYSMPQYGNLNVACQSLQTSFLFRQSLHDRKSYDSNYYKFFATLADTFLDSGTIKII